MVGYGRVGHHTSSVVSYHTIPYPLIPCHSMVVGQGTCKEDEEEDDLIG